jgi:hypothetical protein
MQSHVERPVLWGGGEDGLAGMAFYDVSVLIVSRKAIAAC